MKKILAIALVLTLVLSLSVTAFADDIKVAFSQIGQESDWRTANTDSIKGTIEGHDGWTLIYDDAQQKQERPCATSSPRALTTSSSPALLRPVGTKSLPK